MLWQHMRQNQGIKLFDDSSYINLGFWDTQLFTTGIVNEIFRTLYHRIEAADQQLISTAGQDFDMSSYVKIIKD